MTSGWREKIDRVTAMLGVQHCISVIVERDDVKKVNPFQNPIYLQQNDSQRHPRKSLFLKIQGVE